MRTLVAAPAPGEDGAGGSGEPPRTKTQSNSGTLHRENDAVKTRRAWDCPELREERYLIAGLLAAPDSLAEARRILGDSDAHFWARETGAVWRVMIQNADAGLPVAEIAIRESLTRHDDLQAIWVLDDAVALSRTFTGHGVARAVIRRAKSLVEAASLRRKPPVSQPAQDLELSTPTGVIFLNMAEVEPRSVSWLWKDKIALGKLTTIAGDPGLGKSMLTLDLAARVSTGAPWPDGSGNAPIGGVVLLSAEDDVHDTVRPRLDRAKADVRRINALQGVRFHDEKTDRLFERSFCLNDLGPLEELIDKTPDCRLVVIDPVSAFTGATDSHNNAEVRAMLMPLSDLAAKRGVAVLTVTHNNKGNSSALHKVMGSVAFTAATRGAFGVYKDKEDPSKRLFLPIKNNIGPDDIGLAYRVQVEAGVGCIEWFSEPVRVSADLAVSDTHGGGENSRRELALDWLLEFLADGPVSTEEIQSACKAAGFSFRTVERAKNESKGQVVAGRTGFGRASRCHWRLKHMPPPQNARSGSLAAYGNARTQHELHSEDAHRPPGADGGGVSNEDDFTTQDLERMADDASDGTEKGCG